MSSLDDALDDLAGGEPLPADAASRAWAQARRWRRRRRVTAAGGVAALTVAGLLIAPFGRSDESAEQLITPPTTSASGCPLDPMIAATPVDLLSLAPDGTERFDVPLPKDGELSSAPPITDGNSVWVHAGGNVLRFDAAGKQVWSASAPGAGYHLWLDSGVLTVLIDQVGDHGYLLGLDPETGKQRWRHDLAGLPVLGDPVLTGDGGLAWAVRGAGVEVLDVTSGRIRWRAGGVSNSAALGVFPGMVVRTVAGHPTAYDLTTGTVRWISAATADDDSPFLATGDVLVVASRLTKQLTAIVPATGAPAWTYARGVPWVLLSAGPAGVTFQEQDAARQKLRLVDPRGRELFVVAADAFGPPVVGGADVVGFERINLTRRDLTGKVVARVRGYASSSSNDQLHPLGSTGLVAFGYLGPDNLATAYDRNTGKVLWNRKINRLGNRVSVTAYGVVVQDQNPLQGCFQDDGRIPLSPTPTP